MDFSGSAPLAVSFQVDSFFGALLYIWLTFPSCYLLWEPRVSFFLVPELLSMISSGSSVWAPLALLASDWPSWVVAVFPLHSRSVPGTFHTKWGLMGWYCVQCYPSGHSQELLTGHRLGPATLTHHSSLTTWSSFLSRLLGVLSAASLGGLGYCGVLPEWSPTQLSYIHNNDMNKVLYDYCMIHDNDASEWV